MLPVISNLVEVHIFRVNENSMEFLLLKRSETEIYPGIWQMVSGSIRKSENASRAALREIMEETSLKPKKLWVVPNISSFYSHEKNFISLLPVFAAQVNNNSKVIISDEHTKYIWCNKTKAKKLLAWIGQKKSVDIIYEYFTKKQNLLKFIEVKI